MISPPPEEIRWYCNQWQPAYEEMKSWWGVELFERVPTRSELIRDRHIRKLVVLDDMMRVMSKDPLLLELFTEGSHHWNITVVFINQMCFFGDRTTRSNAHYNVLMNSPADKLQILNLAKQMKPGRVDQFMSAYSDAVTRKPYNYLLIQNKPTVPENERFCTEIFPDEIPTVYEIDD